MSVEAAKAFIARCSEASASERANSQRFLSELCDVIGVPRSDPHREKGYGFEYPVTQQHADGMSSQRKQFLARSVLGS